MTANKMHRNGEKTPPTEPGIYRFFGKRCGHHLGAKDVELTVTDEMWGDLAFVNPSPDDTENSVCVLRGMVYEGLGWYEGRWWGPVRSLEEEGEREFQNLKKICERAGYDTTNWSPAAVEAPD